MKILLVSSFLPYPLFSGGQVRLYNLLKKLQKKHEITLICEIRPQQKIEDVEEVEKVVTKVITVPRKKQWSAENILKTGFSDKPFLLTGHLLPEMTEAITKELQTDSYDLIHVETFYVMQNLPGTIVPIVLVEHNVEYALYQRFMKKSPFFLKPLLQIDVSKLKNKEQMYWKKAAVVVAVSKNEEEVIKKITNHTAVVPNGVDLDKFTVKSPKFTVKKERKNILYIGDFKYIQNRDAALWIIEKVFPLLQKELGDRMQLWIVGRNMSDELKNKAVAQIILDDNSSLSTPEIFQQADVLLAPIRVGGGTSYKILEAMASGTPVVTTTLGNEGINAENNKEIMIADTVDDMVAGVKALVENKEMYETMANRARKVIERDFSWEMIAERLDEVYREVVK